MTSHRGFGTPGQCFVIAEVAQAHDGSLGTAHAFIDAVARTGANAIKFQTHIARAESSPSEPWRVRFSPQDDTRYAYWQRMEFSEEQWLGLKRHADERGLAFLSSPFSIEAVELLTRVGVPAWKIASGEVSNPLLLGAVLATRRPVICSTGMSPWTEIDALVASVRAEDVPITLLQCTSVYPCPPERVGLNMLGALRARYDCPVGLSDHSGTIFPGLAAVALGCDVLEVHVTLSREAFGPDVTSSLTTAEIRTLVEGIRATETMLAHPVDKDASATSLAEMRRLFTKSVVAARDLPQSHALSAADLSIRKPGTGISAARLPELLGRRIKRAYTQGEFLDERDLEERT